MKKTARMGARLLPWGVGGALALVCNGAAAGPTFQHGEQGFVTLGYSLQGWTQYRDFTSPTDSGASIDTFLRRNRITLTGQYNDYVGFYAQLDTGSDSRGGNDDEPVFYRDAYITFDYSDPVRLIFGRFKNTFSRENLEACLEPLTMDRAEVLAFTPFAGSRDTGLALWGNLADATMQYRVMMADGREGDAVVSDSPRLTARFHWSPWDPEYAYGYRGTYLGTQRVLTIGASYDTQADVAYGNFANRADPKGYDAWTVDVFVEYPTAAGTPTFSAATFDYSVDGAVNENPDPNLNLASELDGYYAKAGYLLADPVGIGRLQFFMRHENLDYNLDSGLFDNVWNSAGFHYYLDGQKLKFSFEYAKVDFDRDHPTSPAYQDYAQATMGFQMIF